MKVDPQVNTDAGRGLTTCYHPPLNEMEARRRLALPVDPCERAEAVY